MPRYIYVLLEGNNVDNRARVVAGYVRSSEAKNAMEEHEGSYPGFDYYVCKVAFIDE